MEEKLDMVQIELHETTKYYSSLLRLLDKIELVHNDQMQNEDLANIYELLSILNTANPPISKVTN